jgi:hypothetical protein
MRRPRLRTAFVAVCLPLLAASQVARADTAEECVAASDKSQLLRDQRKYVEARVQLLRCSAEKCPLVVRKDCARWFDEVEARLPGVVVSVRDPDGHDVFDVNVYIDGKLVSQRLDGKALPVDPGPHVFRYEARGASPVEEQVLVREGEASRLLTVNLVRTKPQPTVEQPPPPRHEEERSPRRIPLSSIALTGVGLLGIGGFAFFASEAKSNRDDLRATCGTTQSCAQSDVDGVHRDLIIANVALGVGVIALASAAWIFFTR